MKIASILRLRNITFRVFFPSFDPKYPMRIPLIASALLLFSSLSHAQEIKVRKPELTRKSPTKVKQYDTAAKKWVDIEGYGYTFFIFLENISDKPLTVITKGLTHQSSPSESNQNLSLSVTNVRLADGGPPLIPPREDLGLVDLRPGEAAGISLEFSTYVPLEELTVTYNPQDLYDGRFGYWTGNVSSEPLKFEDKK